MQRLTSSLVLGLSLCAAGLSGCGDDSSTDDGSNASTGTSTATDTGTPSTDTETPATDTGPATTDPDTGTTSDTPADTTEGESSTGPSGACQVWEVTYDLTGSEFEISGTAGGGAGDQVNTVMEPYDQNDHIGPGNFVLHFQDVDGGPGNLAYMHSFDMDINFVVDGAVTVTTDLESYAGPEECGITVGAINGTSVAWAPPAIVDYTSEGTVLCEGALCGLGGLPNGKPVDMNETSDQPVNSFEFNEDFTAFTMEEIITGMDESSTQSWMYIGTELNRALVDAPECLCR